MTEHVAVVGGGVIGLCTAYYLRRGGADVTVFECAAIARTTQPYLSEWQAESLRDEWMGMRPMTPDGLPVIGRAHAWPNLSIASGHGMIGVTLAPPTGHALARLILENCDPEELRPFSPKRFAR